MLNKWINEYIKWLLRRWKNECLNEWVNEKIVSLFKIFDEIMNEWMSELMNFVLFLLLLLLVVIMIWRINFIFCIVKLGVVSWLFSLSVCGFCIFFWFIEKSFVVEFSFKLIFEEGYLKIV